MAEVIGDNNEFLSGWIEGKFFDEKWFKDAINDNEYVVQLGDNPEESSIIILELLKKTGSFTPENIAQLRYSNLMPELDKQLVLKKWDIISVDQSTWTQFEVSVWNDIYALNTDQKTLVVINQNWYNQQVLASK